MTNSEIKKVIEDSNYDDLFAAYLDCEGQDKNYFVQCLLNVFTRFRNTYSMSGGWVGDELKRMLSEELCWEVTQNSKGGC